MNFEDHHCHHVSLYGDWAVKDDRAVVWCVQTGLIRPVNIGQLKTQLSQWISSRTKSYSRKGSKIHTNNDQQYCELFPDALPSSLSWQSNNSPQNLHNFTFSKENKNNNKMHSVLHGHLCLYALHQLWSNIYNIPKYK